MGTLPLEKYLRNRPFGIMWPIVPPPLPPEYEEETEPETVKTPVKTGPLNCRKCNELYEYAEPNQPDGTLVCWSCRR